MSGTQAADVTSIWPIAVFESGAPAMISTRNFANAWYGAYGVGPGSQDGQCKYIQEERDIHEAALVGVSDAAPNRLRPVRFGDERDPDVGPRGDDSSSHPPSRYVVCNTVPAGRLDVPRCPSGVGRSDSPG